MASPEARSHARQRTYATCSTILPDLRAPVTETANCLFGQVPDLTVAAATGGKIAGTGREGQAVAHGGPGAAGARHGAATPNHTTQGAQS